MFTFSFGSTIAWATTTYETNGYNESVAKTYFKKAMDDLKAADEDYITVGGTGGYTVYYSTLEKFYDKLETAALEMDKAIFSDTAAAARGYVGGDSRYTLEYLVNFTPKSGWNNATWAAINNSDLAHDLVEAQYEADKADAIAALNSVSVSDFSTDKMDPKCDKDGHSCTTYQDHVKALIADAISDINDFTYNDDTDIVNSNGNVKSFTEAKAVIDAIVGSYSSDNRKNEKATLIAEKGYTYSNSGIIKIGYGVYEVNENYADTTSAYNGKELKTYKADSKKYDDAVTEANKAAAKANVATAYAKYLQENNTTDQREFADNMKTALEYLIDHNYTGRMGKMTAITANEYEEWFFTSDKYTEKKNAVKYAVEKVESLNDSVKQLAAQKDSTGALVRDAEDVADELEKASNAIYAIGVDLDATNGYSGYGSLIDDAYTAGINAVKDLYVSLDTEKLAFAKKWAETKIQNDYADAKDDYYPAEYAEYKALVDEYVAKIESADTEKKVYTYLSELGYSYSSKWTLSAGSSKISTKVNKKETVTGTDGRHANAVTYLVNAAKTYADVVYAELKGDNRYAKESNETYTRLRSDIEKLVGESDARTDSAIKALSNQAIALVANLPTIGAVNAAEDAVDDAYDAIPKTVKLDSKAAIDAAIAAADAYEDLTGKTSTKVNDITNKVVAYAYAVNDDLKTRLDATSKTDKEALKALKAEAKAFEDTYEDYTGATNVITGGVKKDIQSKLNDIQKTEKEAVKAAITAIPVKENITEANKATVENARKLYDAYVAEYTDYEGNFAYDTTNTEFAHTVDYYDGFAADDIGAASYQDLVGAETVLGLNEDPAAPVEALKIKASSTAKKGSITVKWTVTGDASTVDGYEIWKSTKQSKGFKKAFTTTKTSYKNTKDLKKGTRYYYKVRAYKMVDGVKVTSDWSNKAYRKAK